MNIMMCIMLQNSHVVVRFKNCGIYVTGWIYQLPLMLSSDMTHFICICNIILDLSSVTRFGRDQFANICRPYFLTLKKVVSSLLRFLWKQGELALVITPIFVYGF